VRRGRAQARARPPPPQPDDVGLGLPAGWVAPVGPGEAGRLVAGECAVGTGLGDVGEAAVRVGDGLVGVGEGLARRVVGDGVGEWVGVGLVAGPVVPSDEFDPAVVEGSGRTTR
jgi:hypothetical protein